MRARIAIIALAAGALLTAAGTASASALPGAGSWFSPRSGNTSLTLITNDPDGGHGTPATWATDTIWRTVTVTRGASVPASDCGQVTGTCWAYDASLSDSGTFRTIPGAGTPNQACTGCAGEKIRHAVNGALSGTYSITFYASSGTPSAALVPAAHDDHGAAASPPFTSTTWPELFFPAGTHFGGPVGGAYSWTYTAATAGFPPAFQTWTDSSANAVPAPTSPTRTRNPSRISSHLR